MQNSSGPACDECRQRKVKCDRVQPACGNCARNSLNCEFSNRVKRVNHARQLVEDVADLNDRLDSIDGALHQLVGRMNDIAGFLHHSYTGTNTPVNALGLRRSREAIVAFSDASSGQTNSATPNSLAQGSSNVVQSITGLERFYGSFSTHALFYTARKIMENIIIHAQNVHLANFQNENDQATNSSIKKLSRQLDPSALPNLLQAFQTWNTRPYDEDDMDSRPQMVSLPPYWLLEASLQYFFDGACWEWPIFHRESVVAAIQLQYSQGQSSPDIAWRLCLNNIVLLSLNSKSEATSSNTAFLKVMEDDILTSLVINAKRGINFTPALMAPRLVNVQALLSLVGKPFRSVDMGDYLCHDIILSTGDSCLRDGLTNQIANVTQALVARDYFHYSIFERMLFSAFQVASAMGLQEEYNRATDSSNHDIERRDLIWAIYALDKQRCFIRGSSCLLYQFECSVKFPTHQTSSFGDRWNARLLLACIMEEVYRTLYSPKAQQQNQQFISETVKDCDQLLQDWYLKHKSLLIGEIDIGNAESLFAKQLRYSYYACLILIHRRGIQAQNQLVCLESARKALKIVQMLVRGEHCHRSALLALKWIFNSCSIMAYYEVWVHVLHSTSSENAADIAALSAFTRALNLLADPAYPHAYCARVSKAIQWCTTMLRVIQDMKITDGAVAQNVQYLNSSPTSQLSAWQLLEPAFFSNSPYGHDFISGEVLRPVTQMPMNLELDTDATNAFGTHLQQPSWPQHLDAPMNATPSDMTSLAGIGSISPATTMPFQNLMYQDIPLKQETMMLSEQFLSNDQSRIS